MAEIAPENLRSHIDPSSVVPNIKHYPATPIFIGRERAKQALDFGLSIDEGHYHLFVLGPPGTGKKSTVLHLLKERSKNMPPPQDWCYVFNFSDESSPIALSLPPGQGTEFKKSFEHFSSETKLRIGKAFESEEYGRRKQFIDEEAGEQRKEVVKNLEVLAKQYSFEIMETPFGIAFVPMLKKKPMTDQEIEDLNPAKQEILHEGQKRLAEESASLGPKLRRIERETAKRIEKLHKEIVGLTVEPLICELLEKFKELPKVISFIEAVKGDIIENASKIKSEGGEPSAENAVLRRIFSEDRGLGSHFERYEINLFISNNNKEAPVILEALPTVPRLIGRYEFKPRFGSLTTDFTLLRPGVLHQANGGYLVLDAIDLLTQPFAWDVLKSVLESRCIRVEDVTERLPYSLPTPTLRPEPIPLTAKVILLGQPMIYYLLAELDKDFLELFKVKVDFETETKVNKDSLDKFSAFVYYFSLDELKIKIKPEGIARLAEEAQRLAEHQKRLSLEYRVLTDLLREAKYWSNKKAITKLDIEKAIESKIYRSNLVEEKIREMIAENTIFIDTEGMHIGQTNGVSVLQLGDYQFGKPSRITARIYVGKEGVINIERKTDLSGPIHGKAVMILANYLGGKFAQQVPLAINASLTFEQEYSLIEGDSATVSELCALLSALSGLPVRQDLVITGSANQFGQVQPIGGVNQKIEGFFMVCKEKGLTGTQGALIPYSNAKHLMLNDQVINAVREKKFHIYTMETVDEAMELLCGKPIELIDKNIEEKLKSFANQWRKYSTRE